MSNIFWQIITWIENYFTQMSNAEFYSTLAIASAALLFIIAERFWPYDKGQKVLREGFFDDLALYTIAQSYILGIFIFTYVINFIDSSTGLSRLQLFRDVPIWIQLLFFLITHDLYIYWMHRWQHSNKYLWRIHEAHHSPKKVDWLSGSRSHALEILINQTIEFLPIVLLGSPPEVIAYKGVMSACIFIQILIYIRVSCNTLLTDRKCTAGIIRLGKVGIETLPQNLQYGTGFSEQLFCQKQSQMSTD
jgi:sterol desaturase/sphingolipid hydroxylase (fatty acid hydroxylase superfamily)